MYNMDLSAESRESHRLSIPRALLRILLFLGVLFANFGLENPAQAQMSCSPYWAMLPHFGANVPDGGSVNWPVGREDFEIVVRDDNRGNLTGSVTSSDPNVVVVGSPGGVAHHAATVDTGTAVLTAVPEVDDCPRITVKITVKVTEAPTVHDTTTTVQANSENNPVNLDFDGYDIQSVGIEDGSGPEYGTATATGTGVTYTPNPGFSGTDEFLYTATNAAGTSTPATATIIVNPPPPTIDSIAPNSGPAVGGTTVNITGTHLTGATNILFGGIAAASFTVNSETEITSTAPAHATGIVDVEVVTPFGSAAATGGFTYLSSDAGLSGLLPSEGVLDPAFDSARDAYNVVVDQGTETITLTPEAADSGATITVNEQPVTSGSSSQAITLPVGATPITIVVTAADGVMQQIYTVTVMREEIATTLTLTQSAKTSRIGDTVTFNADLSDAVDPNGNVIFTIGDVDSAVGLTGNLATFEASDLTEGNHTIAARYEGDTNGNADSTATPITHRVEVLDLPIARDHMLEVMAGTSGMLDLTQGASGGPFTASITVHPPGNTGEARIVQKEASPLLHFAAAGSFVGATSLTYTLSNADGTSEPATVTLNVIARPDPSLDPEVIGLIRAQSETAKRFATTQITNFSQRLEQLHNEGARRSNPIGLSVGLQQLSADVNAYAPQEEILGDPAVEAISRAAPAAATGDSNAQPAPIESLFGDLAFWSGGFVNFGTNDDGAINLNHTLVGVSAGVDYRFTPELTAGFGVGYGRDVTDAGSNGTESRAEAFSLVAYGSYRPMPGVFLDGLAGYSTMSFDSLRYITTTGEFATGSRSGDQLFASISAGYEYRKDGLLISPYGRLSGSHSTLGDFTESGAGIWNLIYGEQTIDTLSGTLGLRFAYDIPVQLGVLTPYGRLEYTHDFEGSSRAKLGYADLNTMPYALNVESYSRDHLSISLGFDTRIGNDWTLGFDYRTAFSTNGDSQTYVFGARLGAQF